MKWWFPMVVLVGALHIPGFAGDVEVIRNAEVARLISFSKVLAEKDLDEQFRVRIVVDHIYGDCGRPGPSCPKERLLLAVVRGELPGDSVFTLGQSYGWKFLEWRSFPAEQSLADPVVEFVLQKREGLGSKFVFRKVLVKIVGNDMPEVIDIGPA